MLASGISATIVPSGSQARLILIGTALLLALGMGIRQSFGLFLEPVTHDLAVTAADFTLSLAVQNIVWGLSQALIGSLADRFGLRIMMIAGAAIYVVGLGIMAVAQGALALFISGGLIGVALSCTATSLTMTACVRAVSEERRSMTLGLVSAAGSLGTMVGPLATPPGMTFSVPPLLVSAPRVTPPELTISRLFGSVTTSPVSVKPDETT